MPLDPRILLLLLPLLAGLAGQRRVSTTFETYRQVPVASDLDGRATARQLLDTHAMHTVTLERTPGTMGDHFDSDARTVRLSAEVADGTSVAATAIAAHEVAHAHQDETGHLLYRARMRIARPLAQLSRWSGLILIGALWFQIPLLIAAAAGLLVGSALFALVTLPVELDASRTALRWLQDRGLVTATELPGARRMLRAAASTYLAATGRRVGLLLFILLGFVLAGS